MAAIVQRDTPHIKIINVRLARTRGGLVFTLSAIYTGCTMRPTKRSEIARLHKNMVDGERREGLLNMAANTKEMATMDTSISGELRTLTTMTIVSVVALVALVSFKFPKS